jgi:hypothetical protein
MKSLFSLSLAVILIDCAFASEPGFVRTYQPLGGLANGTIHVEPVICVSRNAYSDDDRSLPMSFISAPYTPPGDADVKNINLAAVAGVEFVVSREDPKHAKIVFQVESLPDDRASAQKYNNTREVVFTAILECLRLCVPEELKDASLVLATESKDKAWLEQIIDNYNKHNKTLPFYNFEKNKQVVIPSGP